MTSPEENPSIPSGRPSLHELQGWETLQLRQKKKSILEEPEEFFILREIIYVTNNPGSKASDGADLDQLFRELMAKLKAPLQKGNFAYFRDFAELLRNAHRHMDECSFADRSTLTRWLILTRSRFIQTHGRIPTRREGKKAALRLMAEDWLKNSNSSEEDVLNEIEEIKALRLNWTRAFDSLRWEEGADERGRPTVNSTITVRRRRRR